MKNTDFELYNEETKEFGMSILSFLREKYGEVPEVFNHSLKILLTNYNIWSEAKSNVLKNGAMIKGAKDMKKNPAYKILQDSQVYIHNELKEFGLTPRALKSLNRDDDKPAANSDDLLEILKNL